jgi:hypothetical protein
MLSRLNKRLLWCTAGGIAAELAGLIFLAAGFQPVANVLTTYPGSWVFHLVPGAITDRLSEATLFFFGFFSGALLWAAALYGLSRLTRRSGRRPGGRAELV